MPTTRRLAAVVACLCLSPGLSPGFSPAAQSASLDKALAKLGPEERAQQACVIKGLSKMVTDKALPGADSIETSALGKAVIAGTRVTTKGGAVRAKHRWYRLSFDCTLTQDQMKATAFTYTIGPEIPKEKWEDIGLWD